MRRLGFLLIAVLVACRQPTPGGPKPTASGPQVAATVLTVQTTTEPEKKSFKETIVIVGDRARNTGEHETWRLYDTKAKTVTFVDDVARTTRVEPLAAILTRRTGVMQAELPGHFPPATFTATNERRALQGVNAGQVLIRSGAYKRELWLGEHPAIPRGLFAMMQASEPLTSPLAPMMRTVDAALLETTGFPLLDRTEIPLNEGNVIIERTVTRVAQQQVAQDVVALPKGYRDVTPKPPGAKKSS